MNPEIGPQKYSYNQPSVQFKKKSTQEGFYEFLQLDPNFTKVKNPQEICADNINTYLTVK